MATGPAKLVASITKASAVVYEDDNITDADKRASFQLNNVGIDGDPVADDDEIALAKIRKKTKILPDGRYQSGWPYIDDNPQLPTNLNLAHKRNWGTWSTVSRDPALLDTYDGIIWDWVDNDVAEVVNMEEDYANEYLKHYLPHHPVVRKDKATTKVLPHIVGMHLNFRWYHIVISADIAKAFLQIELPPEDRDVCRFLWVKDKTKPPTKDNLLVLRFKRVPFGVKTSPTLLAVVIQEICKNWNTPVSREVSRHIYVDNVLLFADSAEEAVAKSLEAHKMFAGAKMNLREFESSIPLDLPQELLAPPKPTSKFLGVVWDKP
ncbi:Pao retrotransposon peptidase family protein [Aphelenchoides avenae]|nr:Pao retrotransposon peptidase family protein [Aphelenchus avenae]